jgi:hypothetical protein
MNSTGSIGTIPTSLTHWNELCTYRIFKLRLFLDLSTRMGPNDSFPARSMGCSVHVTTRGWIQLTGISGTIPSLTHLEPLLYITGSSSSTVELFQLGWANPFVSFSTCSMVVTYMWLSWRIQLTAIKELSHFFWRCGAVIVRTGSSSSNIFGIFQLGWALTLWFLSACSMGL